MATDGDGFAVHYDDTDATYPITIDPIAQGAYLKTSNTGFGDLFGASVAVSGDTGIGTLFRATLSGSPAPANEGVWANQSTLLLRKGTAFDAVDGAGNLSEDLMVARFLRFWPG